MRTINLTVEIPDDDQNELIFRDWVNTNFGDSVKDIRTLPNTDDLYENDKTFRELCKKEKEARKVKNDYINKHNFNDTPGSTK